MADDSLPDIAQISLLFPQLDHLQLVGQKGPLLIFEATLKSNFAAVMLRLLPTEAIDLFGWTDSYIAEIKTVAKNRAPHLIRLYDAGRVGDYLYLLSERPPFPRLSEYTELPKLQPKQAFTLIRDLATDLLPLHQNGIIHGGISPKHLVLQQNGQQLSLLPINVFPKQTPAEMGDFASPEWITGSDHALTPSMDIYSLGVTLYLLLTGKTPMEAEFVMPSDLVPACTPQMDDVVAAAIEPNPEERLADLPSFIKAIDKALGAKRFPAAIPNAAGTAGVASAPAAATPGRTPTPLPGRPITPTPTGKSHFGKETSLYFYLLPVLIISIVLTYTCILYKKDVAQMHNDYNEMVKQSNREKISSYEKARKEAKKTTTQKKQELPPPVVKAEPVKPAKVDQSNLCSKPGVVVKQTSTRNLLSAYGPEKAIDGIISPFISSGFVSVTDTTDGQTSKWGIILDDEDSSVTPIKKIVIHIPTDTQGLDIARDLKVIAYDADKNIIAEKELTVAEGQSSVTWTPDTPIKAHDIRICTKDNDQILAISELILEAN